MARRPTAPTRLNAANLTRLGAPRLAELLAEASVGDANLKRRLRLESAAEAGPDRLAAEIDKRIAALAAARVRVSWRKRGELILLGAVVGGLLLDHLSIHAVLIASIALAAVAVLIVRDGRTLLKPR